MAFRQRRATPASEASTRGRLARLTTGNAIAFCEPRLPPPTEVGCCRLRSLVEWPNPRYSEVRLGGGRPASAGREGGTALKHMLRRCRLRRRCHPTPDCLR